MAITLRFFGGSDAPARAIEWFTASPFSHVAAVWSASQLLDSRDDTVAGVKPGVRVREALTETADIIVDLELRTTAEQLRRWRDFLAAQLGKPYDKPAIVGFALGRDWREPDSWFCSELQAAALEAAGLCPRLYAPANRITPGTLASILSALGATEPMAQAA